MWVYVGGGWRYSVASNPGFLFWILSCSFGEKSEGKSCKLFHVSGSAQPHAGESLARGIIYMCLLLVLYMKISCQNIFVVIQFYKINFHENLFYEILQLKYFIIYCSNEQSKYTN